jgi:hypothetical protein
VDVVHHPREGRCVLRYRLSLGAGGAGELRHPVVFGKVYADSSARAAASALRLLRDGLRSLPDGIRVDVPRPLAVVAPLRLGLVEALPGRPLLPDLLKSACDPRGASTTSVPPALTDALRTAAQTAAAVHSCPASGAELPVRNLTGERAATERDLMLLESVWPEVAASLRRGLAGALRSLPARSPATAAPGWPLAPVLAHGDFTPSQVLLDASGGAGLVDVDTLCIAEPALDLGRFLAYLQVTGLRRSRAAGPLLAELTALVVTSYLDASRPSDGATAPRANVRRLLAEHTAVYRALTLARLGARACWQLKDDRLAAVMDVLDAGNEWMRDAAG